MSKLKSLQKKPAAIIVWALALILCALCLTLFCVFYYVPLREVKPIIKLLESCKREDVEDADLLIRGLRYEKYPDGTRGLVKTDKRINIRGAGAKKVKQALLRALQSSDDCETLQFMFLSIMGVTHKIGKTNEDLAIGFNNDEWARIKTKTDKFNEMVGPRAQKFFVLADTNNECFVTCGGPPIIDYGR